MSTCCGTIKIKRPRVRGLKERFESRILPLFARHTKEVGALLPELYLHGLAQGDFELALRGLLGDGAPLSSPSIARLRGQWETDYQTWQERRLDDRELVYAWADDDDGGFTGGNMERSCWVSRCTSPSMAARIMANHLSSAASVLLSASVRAATSRRTGWYLSPGSYSSCLPAVEGQQRDLVSWRKDVAIPAYGSHVRQAISETRRALRSLRRETG